jgi:hypothetical protein
VNSTVFLQTKMIVKGDQDIEQNILAFNYLNFECTIERQGSLDWRAGKFHEASYIGAMIRYTTLCRIVLCSHPANEKVQHFSCVLH